MNSRLNHPIIFLLAFLLLGCAPEELEEDPLATQIAQIKTEFAPDKRVALFDISAINNKERYVLSGESDLPEAIASLKERLWSENIDFVDSIQLLPSPDLQGMTQGVIRISVANLRSKPAHSAELATQATLGTPVKVLKKENEWYYIQTPDKYLSWVDAGGLEIMDTAQAEQWKSATKLIYTNTFGHSYSLPNSNSQVVSDLVAGNILEILETEANFYTVRYPDGRQAHVYQAEGKPYNEWLEALSPNGETLVSTSKTLMGLPYLWGGTSPKGVDCSGFTKTIFFLNGMVIPRDASQQVHTGKPIDSTRNFESLERGDLLFFGRKATDSTKEKVVHVGMWIGDNEFIHSSGQVRISSMDKEAENFDEYNLNRYLRTKRLLQEEDKGLINLTQTPVFRD